MGMNDQFYFIFFEDYFDFPDFLVFYFLALPLDLALRFYKFSYRDKDLLRDLD